MVAAVGIDGVKDTRDRLTDWGRAGAKKCVEELAKKVDVIMFSCTGFSTMGIAHWFPDLNVPIIDAIEAALPSIGILPFRQYKARLIFNFFIKHFS